MSETTSVSNPPPLNRARSEELAYLEDAVHALQEGFILWDADLKFVFCNEKCKQLALPAGHPGPRPGQDAIEFGAEVFRTGFWELPPGLDANTFAEHIGSSIRSYVQDLEITRADGRVISASSNNTSVGGYVLTFMDITERRRAEDKRLEAFNDAIQAAQDGLALFDADGRFVLANKAWHGLYAASNVKPQPGDRVEDLHRRFIEDDVYILPEGATKESYYEDGIRSIYGYDADVVLEFQSGRVCNATCNRTELGAYLLSFQDVTNIRRAEDKLLESVIDALQSLTDGIALFDSNFEYVVGNQRYLDMWYPGDIREPHPGERIEDIARRVVTAGHMKLPAGLSVDEMCEGLVSQARHFQKDLQLETQDAVYLASSHQTSLGGYLLEFTDVTDRLRVEQELARQKEMSYQNEKLSALGELLAGVAHELNNPLSVVFGYAQMLSGQVDDPKIAERLELIRQSAERAAKIVKTFLAMARQRPAKVELCSLNGAVETAVEVSSYSLVANGTRIKMDLDPSVPLVSGDFDQLAQVFTNLIVNAGHALAPLRDRGELTLQTFHDPHANQTIVCVRDNGPGIPSEIQSRIFEPFFTTKDVGEGTGVGLAFSHRIVESHGGILELISQVGQGSSFYVRLASVAGHAGDVHSPKGQVQKRSSRSVLVLDDEPGVARLTSDLLTDAGFLVTQTVSPRDALSLLESRTFDMVVSDFKMPGMDGEQFYKALKIVAPECAERIGFITGDAMGAHVRYFFETSGRPFIEKPIMKDELLAMMDQLCPARLDNG